MRLVARSDALRIGAWNDSEQPFMGPLIGEAAAASALAAEGGLAARGAKRMRHDGAACRNTRQHSFRPVSSTPPVSTCRTRKSSRRF